jgi:hypothetical protein
MCKKHARCTFLPPVKIDKQGAAHYFLDSPIFLTLEGNAYRQVESGSTHTTDLAKVGAVWDGAADRVNGFVADE